AEVPSRSPAAEPQVIETGLQPRQALETDIAQAFGTALREGAAGDLHLLDDELVGPEGREKDPITVGGLAQHLQIAAPALIDRVTAHVLEVDRDLRAGDIETESRFGRAARPGICRKDVRGGELRGLIRRQRRHVAQFLPSPTETAYLSAASATVTLLGKLTRA